jgi:magnesium transporter
MSIAKVPRRGIRISPALVRLLSLHEKVGIHDVAVQSGNSGAQALAVTMRGLVLREITPRHWLSVTLKEAGLAGAIVPIVLKRLGQDPAQSSSIILTTVTDVAGFFSFLGIAALLSGLLET